MTAGLHMAGLTVAGRLADIELRLNPGQVTAICGPNGAGKSTLLQCLAGLQGSGVMLDNQLITELSPQIRARAIGYLPQEGVVNWDISVATLIGLGRLPWRGAQGEDGDAIEAAIEALDLAELRSRPVGQLSGGERARALLARVLAGTPQWLLADEPLANLDLAHQQTLLSQFRRLASQGIGVALVLHDLSQAMNFADRVVVLSEGRLIAAGPPEQVLTAAMIGKVWNVRARWLGEPGQRALIVS